MGRTRHTRKRHTRRKHKRKRTRRRRRTRRRTRGGGIAPGTSQLMMAGGNTRRGGRKQIPFSVSDIPPGKAFRKFIKKERKKAHAFAKKHRRGGGVLTILGGAN